MKNKLFRILLTICILVFCSIVTYAEETHEVAYDYSNNTVTVSGEAACKHVYIRILANGKDWDDLGKVPYDDSVVIYRNQADEKNFENGRYCFAIRYADLDDESFQSGVYNAYLTTDETTAPVHIELILFTKKNYETVVSTLNGYAEAEDAVNFKKTLEDNALLFAYNTDLYGVISSENELIACMKYVKQNPLKTDTSVANTRVINTFLAMQEIKENKIENIDLFLDEILDVTSKLYENYEEYTDDENNKPVTERQTYLTEKMVKELPADYKYSDFEDILKKSIVLTGVRFADGYGEVKSVLELYGSSVGITDTATSKVYKAMSGEDYEDANALKKAYKVLKEGGSGSGGSGGGGGGSSSGGSSSKNNGYYSGTNLEVEPEEKPEISETPVRVYFEDIDGVEWASTAILALADKGIINGIGNGKFKPNADVTREEFAKILVGAMGLEDENYNGKNFSDVSDSDWFCPYVNIAYKNNIVKGIGGGKFGTGEPISRQDMVVMICNAIRAKGGTLPQGNIPFEDASLISDYAVSSVSALYEIGTVNGVSETHFDPMGKASRAQAAKIVYGVLEMLK